MSAFPALHRWISCKRNPRISNRVTQYALTEPSFNPLRGLTRRLAGYRHSLPCTGEYFACIIQHNPTASHDLLDGTFIQSEFPIGFGRISQMLRADAHWTLPRRTLWCVERKGQCADAEGFAKGVPNAIAESGFNLFRDSAGRLRDTGIPCPA
jgi:hypothetical protein